MRAVLTKSSGGEESPLPTSPEPEHIQSAELDVGRSGATSTEQCSSRGKARTPVPPKTKLRPREYLGIRLGDLFQPRHVRQVHLAEIEGHSVTTARDHRTFSEWRHRIYSKLGLSRRSVVDSRYDALPKAEPVRWYPQTARRDSVEATESDGAQQTSPSPSVAGIYAPSLSSSQHQLPDDPEHIPSPPSPTDGQSYGDHRDTPTSPCLSDDQTCVGVDGKISIMDVGWDIKTYYRDQRPEVGLNIA